MKEKLFYRLQENLSKWGAVLHESETQWKGSDSYYIVICPNGHTNRQRGYHIRNGRQCQRCQGKHNLLIANSVSAEIRSARSEKRYISYLRRINVEPAWSIWNGVDNSNKVICTNGHECNPRPSDVINGQGVCRICAGREWDIFYLVHNPNTRSFKLGITSNNARSRLDNHKKDGYTELLFLTDNINAHMLEVDLLNALNIAGFKSIKGKEYFRDEALEFIINELSRYNLIKLPIPI